MESSLTSSHHNSSRRSKHEKVYTSDEESREYSSDEDNDNTSVDAETEDYLSRTLEDDSFTIDYPKFSRDLTTYPEYFNPSNEEILSKKSTEQKNETAEYFHSPNVMAYKNHGYFFHNYESHKETLTCLGLQFHVSYADIKSWNCELDDSFEWLHPHTDKLKIPIVPTEVREKRDLSPKPAPKRNWDSLSEFETKFKKMTSLFLQMHDTNEKYAKFYLLNNLLNIKIATEELILDKGRGISKEKSQRILATNFDSRFLKAYFDSNGEDLMALLAETPEKEAKGTPTTTKPSNNEQKSFKPMEMNNNSDDDGYNEKKPEAKIPKSKKKKIEAENFKKMKISEENENIFGL